jgi:hypothetical protein
MNGRGLGLFRVALLTRTHLSDEVKSSGQKLEFVGGHFNYLEGLWFGGHSGYEENLFFLLLCHERFHELIKPPLLSPPR